MDFITGEKFQYIADISIITPELKKYHKNLKNINLYLFPEIIIYIAPRFIDVICKLRKFIKNFTVFMNLPQKLIKLMILVEKLINVNIYRKFVSRERRQKKKKKIILENHISISENLKNSEIIFIYNSDLLEKFFFYIYPHLNKKFILISHNHIYPITQKYEKYLDENKIFKWYSKNCKINHPKLIPIPLGIANSILEYGNESILEEVMQMNIKKKEKAYLNLKIRNNPEVRSRVYKIMKKDPFVIKARRKPFQEYLMELAGCQYSIAPRGSGQDTYRLWESLYLNTIPIISEKEIYENFTKSIWKGTPIIYLSNWNQFSKEFILQKSKKLFNTNDWREKLDFNYWKNRIENDRKELKKIRNNKSFSPN